MIRLYRAVSSLNWSKAIPGTAATLVALIAPTASFVALRALPDSRISDFIANPTSRGVMDLYLQISTLFVALLIILIASINYAIAGKAPLKKWGIAGIGASLLIFLWVFTMGGIAGTSLDYYIPKGPFKPGSVNLPPAGSLITWIRVAAGVFSVILTILELRTPKIQDQPNVS